MAHAGRMPPPASVALGGVALGGVALAGGAAIGS